MKSKGKFFNKVFSKPEYINPRMQLINDVKLALQEVNNLKNNYNFACGEMIDYYSYKIIAAEIRYKYLLEKLKKNDVV